jgi:hypothetical protein
MAGIVRELQKEALDKSVRVSDLLRKALLVARKLKVPEMEAWITSELNGYPKDATFPDYRTVTGQIRARNPITGAWLPVMFPENAREDILDSLTRRQSNQSISEIESMVSDPDGDSMFAMPFSNRVQARLMKGTAMDSPPVLIVQVARLHGIVDAVRTAILDWALKLEEKGILGEDLSFSEADRRAASHITFNIASMSHSQIQADTANSQQILAHGSVDPAQILEFVGKARANLNSLALSAPAAAELQGELATLEAQAKSPKPKPAILRESAKSVRAILEGAGGGAVAQGLLEALRILFG